MLKTLEAAAASASLPKDAYPFEGGNAGAFFTGIRTVVIGGVAHLLFCAEQPGASGDVGYVIVGRLVAPEMRAAACLTQAALAIAKGPASMNRPAN